MSQVEENRATNRYGSRSTVVASLAALGSVIAASSCCLPLLPATAPVSVRCGCSRHINLCRPVATVPACSVGVTHCFWFLQVLAGQTMPLQAQQDQHFSFVDLCDCGVCIHLLPTGDRQPGGRSFGR